MKLRFTVDTHIFRELGQYLVGRDSTALAELVKNTYDADATEVTVYGEALDDLARGMIRIVDNGNGMTAEEFAAGFLRIASRVPAERACWTRQAIVVTLCLGNRPRGELPAPNFGDVVTLRHIEPALWRSVRAPVQLNVLHEALQAGFGWEPRSARVRCVHVAGRPRSSGRRRAVARSRRPCKQLHSDCERADKAAT
jgi:hypothetical protein